MIEFNYEAEFTLADELSYTKWIEAIIISEVKSVGDVCFVFCDDAYLLELNVKHLQHDTFTDIITFDYCVGNEINGDIFISTERIAENAVLFNVSFDNELLRVMAHGVLHLCGYKDKDDVDITLMRLKEGEKIKLF